ncbi:hypothetical protein [Amycolatopsis azurea]|uniref:Lipoprotein n=1 Tax=Amycolatopsis azurea DSM 43854 TaxID=1238180 RepID=A0ABX3J5T4_9PSEU|nr:hypothetical protein [Amycolatopsis azurea]OOC03040.1 hypothetical protein B0293_29165 [Amycolatopsis azurea DSM 43854]
MLRRVLASLAVLALVAGCGPNAPKPPKPADGADLAACADGLCEVSARVGAKVELPAEQTNVESVTVQAVDAGTVMLIARGIGKRQGGSCSGKCEASGTGKDFKAKLWTGSELTYNDLAIKLLGVGDGAAVLKFTPQ